MIHLGAQSSVQGLRLGALKRCERLTAWQMERSIAVMDVRAEDVRRHGAAAAVVLAYLRGQGCSATDMLLVKYAPIARAVGLGKAAVSRAFRRLQRGGALRVEPYRLAGFVAVRLTACADAVHDATPGTQEEPTQVDVGGMPPLSGGDPTSRRLATLRDLLDAVG